MFLTQYAARAGIERRNTQNVHRYGLRRARYITLTKKELEYIPVGATRSFQRTTAWLADTSRAYQAIRLRRPVRATR